MGRVRTALATISVGAMLATGHVSPVPAAARRSPTPLRPRQPGTGGTGPTGPVKPVTQSPEKPETPGTKPGNGGGPTPEQSGSGKKDDKSQQRPAKQPKPAVEARRATRRARSTSSPTDPR